MRSRRNQLLAMVGTFVLTSAASCSSGSTTESSAPGIQSGTASARTTLLDHGARCDGATDDRPALASALTEIAHAGGGDVTVPSARTCVLRAPSDGATLTLSSGVTLNGGAGSTLRLVDGPGRPTTGMFSVYGSDVSIEGLTLETKTSSPSTLITLAESAGFALKRSTLQGANTATADHHGIRFTGEAGKEVANVEVLDTAVMDLSYGMFLSNSDKVRLSSIRVTQCRFLRNRADDIELNAPATQLAGVTIAESVFKDNAYTSPEAAAGFGVGLANARGVVIQRNQFSGYRFAPIHVEDDSSDVAITGNTFSNVATSPLAGGAIVILSGSSNVSITNNSLDLRASAEQVAGILVTAGGENATDPSQVTVQNNTYTLARNALDVVDATSGAVTRRFDRVTRG